MYLLSKGVNLVDDDVLQRAFHPGRRLRRLADVTEAKTLALSSVFSTARSWGADSVLLLQVSRPVTKWIKIEAKCYNLGGNVLWEEVGAYGGGLTGKGAAEKSVRKLTNALEKRLGSDCLN